MRICETKKVPVSDFCPYLQAYHTGYAEIEKITMVGDSRVYGRCTGFCCDYGSKCSVDESECPLIKKSFNIQNW